MKNLNLFKTFESKMINDLPQGWEISDGIVCREFTFDNFLTAMGFLNGVGEIANRMNHHPKMTIDYNKVLIQTYTHDEGRVTNKDLDLAFRVNSLYYP